MITADRVAGLVLVAFALAVARASLALPLGSLRDPGPGFLPMLLALLLAGLALAVVAGGRRSTPVRLLRWPERWHALAILGGCAFAALALERLGYRLTVFALVVFLMRVMERKKAAVAVIAGLGLSLGSFFLFATLLKVPLPRGPLGF